MPVCHDDFGFDFLADVKPPLNTKATFASHWLIALAKDLTSLNFGLVALRSGNKFHSIDEVILRRTGLVL